jgi:hypothetical protein
MPGKPARKSAAAQHHHACDTLLSGVSGVDRLINRVFEWESCAYTTGTGGDSGEACVNVAVP